MSRSPPGTGVAEPGQGEVGGAAGPLLRHAGRTVVPAVFGGHEGRPGAVERARQGDQASGAAGHRRRTPLQVDLAVVGVDAESRAGAGVGADGGGGRCGDREVFGQRRSPSLVGGHGEPGQHGLAGSATSRRFDHVPVVARNRRHRELAGVKGASFGRTSGRPLTGGCRWR